MTCPDARYTCLTPYYQHRMHDIKLWLFRHGQPIPVPAASVDACGASIPLSYYKEWITQVSQHTASNIPKSLLKTQQCTPQYIPDQDAAK